MARKRYKPEEIVAKLRQDDVLDSQGQNMADATRQTDASEVTFSREQSKSTCCAYTCAGNDA
jgi:putative transposase